MARYQVQTNCTLRCVEGRDGDDGGCNHANKSRTQDELTTITRIEKTCVLDFQLITSIKPEEQNVHHHKFSDAENPLAVPIIVPEE